MIKSAIVTLSVSRTAGGLFESVRRLGQSLQELNMNVDVFSFNDEFTNQDISTWAPLRPQVFQTVGPRMFSYAPGMLSALKNTQLDIIHSHGIWTYHSVAELFLNIHKKTPYLISPHGMLDPWAVQNSHWKKVVSGLCYENAHLRRAACIRSLCTAESEAIRHYGLKNPICQIPNGIDLVEQDTFIAPPWEGKVEVGRKVLLYLGRIHPKKGLANLLRAWSLTQGKNDWVLAIAGWDQGGHENELKALALDLGISNDILFIGSHYGESKAAAYHHASGFVLPSFSEGLPMVVLEAWAHSLPVVMTSFCNLPEGFQCGAALRIEIEPINISLGLNKLFNMTDFERNEMGTRGNALVCQRFTWQKVAEELKQVYLWILGGGTPPSSVRFD